MKFYIYTLGCKVNTYESNYMKERLLDSGYKEGTKEDSDIYIVNTCSVTNTADNKSLKVIRSIIKNTKKSILIVTGCLSQVKYDTIYNIDGVDIVLGNKNKSKIVEEIEDFKKNGKCKKNYDLNKIEFENMKLNNFDKTRAFVKIEDGCNNFCTYCIIPYTRGNVRSKDANIVLDEVKCLVKNGHKEIVLTGIHTGHYITSSHDLTDLISDISKIEGLERIRISSIEITELNDKFLNELKNNKLLVDHLHIPLQSGSNKTLKEMNRKYDKEYFINKIEKIRSIRKDISITTDVIVGFPNESDENFNETIETIKKIRFSKIHVFPYSRRKNTKADLMDNQIDELTKKKRVRILLDLSKELEIEYFNKFIGKEVIFIPEVIKDGYLIGHTGNYLLVKKEGKKRYLNKKVKTVIEKVIYPYVIGK